MALVFCVLTELLISIFVRDGDGVPDGFDNCVDLPNGEQADADGDNIGTKIRKIIIITGLEITAGHWTMSGLIWALTGQPFVLPVMLTGHIRSY